MPSCIIDLTGSDVRTHVTAPLFYPLRRNGQVRFLNGNLSNISALFEQIRVMLLHGPATAPRFIFLLALVDNPDRRQLFKSSLAARLAAIRRSIIEPVQDLGFTLPQSYAIVLDSVRRNEPTGSPVAEVARKAWELDVHGLNEEPSESPFLFSRNELHRLDEAWGKAPSLGGCRSDAGIEGLSTSLADEIRAKIVGFKESFASLMKAKQDALSAFIDDGNSAEPYLSPGVLEDIETDVTKRFTYLTHDTNISPLINLYPSELLALTIAEHLSIAAHEGLFKIFGLRVTENPPQARSRSLVTLDYLLLLLCNHDGVITDQLTETAYAASLDLDGEVIGAAIAGYCSCLERSANALKIEAGNDPTITLEICDNSACTSKVELTSPEYPRGPRFGLFSSGWDKGTWDSFLKETGDRLDAFALNVADKIEECAQDLRLRGKCRTKNSIQDLDGKIREFQMDFEKRRQEVVTGAVPPYTHDWQRSIEKESRDFLEVSEKRPTLRVAVFTLIAAAICFSAGFGSGQTEPADGGLTAQYAVPVLSIVVCIGVTVYMTLVYRARLHRLVGLICENAGISLDKLETNFNNARKFLSSLCALDASRQNLEAAVTAQRTLADRRLKIRYHIERLTAHRENAGKLREVLELGPTPLEPPQIKECHPDYTLPVTESSVYLLSSQAAEQQSIEIEVDSKRFRIESKLLTGLSKARFSFVVASSCGVRGDSSGGRTPKAGAHDC